MKRKYPKNRKEKVGHEQYMDFERVLSWGNTIEVGYMVYDDEWFLCRKGAHHGSMNQIEIDGEIYVKVARVRYFLRGNLTRVLTSITKLNVSNMGMDHYRVLFVKDPFLAATALMKVIDLRKKNPKSGRPRLPAGVKGYYPKKRTRPKKYFRKHYRKAKPRVREKHKDFTLDEIVMVEKAKQRRVLKKPVVGPDLPASAIKRR